MRRWTILSLVLLVLVGCTEIPVNPGPLPPPPPGPVDPTPIPDPNPTPDENVARSKWDAVTMGMTKAEVIATMGASAHEHFVGPRIPALGWYVTFPEPTPPATTPTKGSHYVEVLLDKNGKVSAKNVW